MDQKSFIKIWRMMLGWEWYKDSIVKSLFIHCLLKANWKDENWRGMLIKRGQFVTSYSKLADELGESVQSVRTALKKLEKTKNLTCKSTSKYTVITIEKYNDFQAFDESINTVANNQSTNNQQATNKQLTTIKEYKEIKEENKEVVVEEDGAQNQNPDVRSWKKVFDTYEEEFGRPLTSMEIQLIHDLPVNDCLKIHALKKARANGVLKMTYIRSIAERWHQTNIRSIEEADSAEELFKKHHAEKQVQRGTGGRRPRVIELVPDYILNNRNIEIEKKLSTVEQRDKWKEQVQKLDNTQADEIDYDRLQKLLDSF